MTARQGGSLRQPDIVQPRLGVRLAATVVGNFYRFGRTEPCRARRQIDGTLLTVPKQRGYNVTVHSAK